MVNTQVKQTSQLAANFLLASPSGLLIKLSKSWGLEDKKDASDVYYFGGEQRFAHWIK